MSDIVRQAQRARPLSPAELRLRVSLIVGLTVLACVVMFMRAPIPQSQAFHNFADARPLLGVPNLLNVASNLPFAVVGALGLWFVLTYSALRSLWQINQEP